MKLPWNPRNNILTLNQQRAKKKITVGKIGEELAARFVKEKGLQILERNFRTKRWGELDIVAKEGGVFVFIEVKTRTSLKYGLPADAVDYWKRRSLKRACEYYCLLKGDGNSARRLDVIALLIDPLTYRVLDFTYYRNVPL